MKEKFQQFGKAMLVPITLIAISGLFLGIGSVCTNDMTMSALGVDWDWYSASPLYTFFSVFKGLGEVIIGNLGFLYAVGCAFSLAKKEKAGLHSRRSFATSPCRAPFRSCLTLRA